MNINKEIYTNWLHNKLCEKCLMELSHREIYYNDGVCPYCAHDSNGTICNTVKSYFRYVYRVKKLLGFIPFRVFLRTESK